MMLTTLNTNGKNTNIMQLSVLNDLKKVIEYNSKHYSLNIYVTAWEKLCLAYANLSDPHGDRIFSTVIDPESDYVKTSTIPEDISTVRTMDDAVRHIIECLDEMSKENEDFMMISGFEDLDLDPEEEERHEVYCEASEDIVPVVE